LSEGVTVAFLGVGFLLVGYFLYQQQQDTQILLAKTIAQGSQQKSIFGEILDVGGLVAKAAAFL
jgi:cytochrome c-type biogenesis protein CcmE